MSGAVDHPGAGAAQPGDDELLRRLTGLSEESARPGFHADLRAAFLAGFPGAGADPNADSPGIDPESASRPDRTLRREGGESRSAAYSRTPSRGGPERSATASRSDVAGPQQNDERARAEARLLAALRAQDATADAPRAAFREDLRRCFLSGEFPHAVGDGKGADESRVATRSAGGPEPRGTRLAERRVDALAERRRNRFRLLRGVVAAAAAILVIAVLLPREPSWELRLVEGDGLLTVQGYEEFVSFEDFESDVDAFFEAAEIQTGTNHLELVLPGELVVELTPDSTVDARGLVARPRAGAWRLHLRAGEALISKAPSTRERPLIVQTLDGEVEVLGTTLGVLCSTGYTCVCVADGEVEVRPNEDRATPPAAVRGGNTLVIQRRGDEVLTAMPFPETVCPSTSPHDHHVCTLLGFQTEHRHEE